LAGEAAGSKLTKANELGIPVHDEAWLVAQIAAADSGDISGEKGDTPKATSGANGQLSLF